MEFRGVKIDKCLSCGGVYLDDGELEQLAGRPDWFKAMVSFFKACESKTVPAIRGS